MRETLAAHGIAVEVVAKRRKRGLRRGARLAARGGARLVIAAGGNGTVSAVARGLLGSDAVLGIVPLGATNTLAAAIGVPGDVGQACALIASGSVRSIGVRKVTPAGRKRTVVCFDRAPVGAAAPSPLGQDTQAVPATQDGWWGGPPKSQPGVPEPSHTMPRMRLHEPKPRQARSTMTLLVAASDSIRGI